MIDDLLSRLRNSARAAALGTLTAADSGLLLEAADALVATEAEIETLKQERDVLARESLQLLVRMEAIGAELAARLKL